MGKTKSKTKQQTKQQTQKTQQAFSETKSQTKNQNKVPPKSQSSEAKKVSGDKTQPKKSPSLRSTPSVSPSSEHMGLVAFLVDNASLRVLYLIIILLAIASSSLFLLVTRRDSTIEDHVWMVVAEVVSLVVGYSLIGGGANTLGVGREVGGLLGWAVGLAAMMLYAVARKKLEGSTWMWVVVVSSWTGLVGGVVGSCVSVGPVTVKQGGTRTRGCLRIFMSVMVAVLGCFVGIFATGFLLSVLGIEDLSDFVQFAIMVTVGCICTVACCRLSGLL